MLPEKRSSATLESREAPIPIALLVDICFGVFFAWCARARLATGGPWSQPSVTLVALFVVILLAPTTAYLYIAHPAWSWFYLIDVWRMPRIFVLPVVAASAAAVFGGYYGAARLLVLFRDRRVVPSVLAGLALVSVLMAVLLRGRLLHYASYDDFRAGRSIGIFAVKVGYVLTALVAGLAAGAGMIGWELWRDGRRAASK